MNIIEMKKQTIGVEIEMNSIKREDACNIVASLFNTTNTVKYVGGCYYAWTCKDDQGRTWSFQRDSSISGVDSEKCEMVTPILTYSDIAILQDIVRALRHAGAKSNAKRGCGVHIHVGLGNHDAKSLRNLVNLMASHETLLTSALQISPSRTCTYCKPVDEEFLKQINAKKPSTMDELADVWYDSQHCNYGRNDHYNHSRYHMLNLHSVFTKGTIEFRLFEFSRPYRTFKGGLHAGMIKSWIQWCLAISQTALEKRSASATSVQMDNPKYAMAGWLCNMELTGDEFKTLRDLFTRNLTGNTGRRYVA